MYANTLTENIKIEAAKIIENTQRILISFG